MSGDRGGFNLDEEAFDALCGECLRLAVGLPKADRDSLAHEQYLRTGTGVGGPEHTAARGLLWMDSAEGRTPDYPTPAILEAMRKVREYRDALMVSMKIGGE